MMNTNSGSSTESPQNINDINAIFDRFTTSRSPEGLKTQGRLYLVIDTRTNTIGLTSDKKHASSLRKVTGWINEFTQKTLSNGSVKREEIKNLRDRYSNFVELLPETRFQKILNFLFGYKTEKGTAKELFYTLDDRLSDYGKRQRDKTLVDFSDPKNPKRSNHMIDETISYATYGAIQAHSKERIENNFAKTKDLEEFDIEDITKVFNDEIVTKLNLQWRSDRAMHKLVTGVFEDLLNQFSDSQKESSPTELLADFKLQLRTAIEKRNHVSESIDSDTFRDLMGIRVKEGQGKPTGDIDLDSPQVKKLIKEYDEGTWRSGEERMLEYDVMNPGDQKKLQGILESIINSEAFDAIILKYFESLKKV